MVAALLSGEPHIASRRRTGIVVASDRRACRIARTSLHGHVRELVPWRPSRGLDLAAFARRCVSKKNEERGGGPLRPAGVGDVLSSVASALLLTAAVTLVPLVSQPGVAMADVTDTSMPRTMTDQELQFQQYEQYQKQYKEYQQQQSAYEQMQAKAQPLQKAEVNKGRIWLLFVLGASSLFGVTVVVENNGSWFPAISRANKAMKMSMKAIEERERLQQLGTLDDVRAEAGGDAAGSGSAPDSTQDAVLAGLREASSNAKQTMKLLKEERKEPSMIPMELYAGDAEDEISIDVVDMQAEKSMDTEDMEFDDIGSLLDEPIPGTEDDSDSETGEIGETADEQDDGIDAQQRPADAAAGTGGAPQSDNRKPLFEISGEDIDASIANRAQQFKEELERSSTQSGRDLNVDLSSISLEELQKELEKRNS